MTRTSITATFGYLKIGYVPRYKWDQAINSIWEYGQRWEGRNLGAPIEDIDALYEYFRQEHSWRTGLWPPIEEITPQERDQYFDQVENLFSMRQRMKWNFRYLVDKPHIDYIRVPENWHRQGIALALYEFGATWLAAEKGCRLYASSNQQPGAKLAWDQMEWDPEYPTGREWTLNYANPERSVLRRFLDYTSEYGEIK